MIADDPCPTCGSLERWQTPRDRWICRRSVIQGELSILVVKVWSAHLGEAVWVVADDLPQQEWPHDAPVYTQVEVRILRQMGPDTLAWVHTLKKLFRAQVVVGSRHSSSQAKGACAGSLSLSGTMELWMLR